MGEEVKPKEETGKMEKLEKLEKMENGGASPSPPVKYYGWRAMPYIIGMYCTLLHFFYFFEIFSLCLSLMNLSIELSSFYFSFNCFFFAK
jgi:hypothetical protein